MKRVCVFCGAQPGHDQEHARLAAELGTAIAARGLGLVYGGGKVGLMGVVADAALRGGAEVVGVIPEALMDRELGHGGVTELRVVSSMHVRKQVMNDLSDGFVVLPGGIGTLEEAVEIQSWAQLGIHGKGLVFLDTHDYWAPYFALLERMGSEGFVRPQHAGLALRARSPDVALDLLANWEPPKVTRWMTQTEA
ncbi:LOG family protein [Roseococcus pinisoli]|uniref:Cytokinin riboside 5'-monophosphate phosphoribohydrolase n=1 Tax=Roseococcus pinisoli TaxID=2835040 RepID=A0ABS5QBK1_9PROT|nr:TIGR00730 family Rossman fold protein [Roseococcus pinisoli]MBS7811069.1 TIGR00730 family Rossman fold protein [Roseococcus pinisoli]